MDNNSPLGARLIPSLRFPLWCIPILFILSSALYSGCANVGFIEGGPRDTTAPVVVTAVPANEKTHFTASGFTLFFDEYLQQGNLSNDIQVSPPLKGKVKGSIRGRIVDVEWEDTLYEQTTYLFQFGDGLKDLNEGNVQRNYIYVFSTGDYIDSLTLSGKIENVVSGDKPKDWIVGLYPWGGAQGDSALFTEKPYYYAMSQANGSFVLRYLKAGKYRLLAFNDDNGNFKYDPDLEEVGFLSFPVDPSGDEDMFLLRAYEPRPQIRKMDQRFAHKQGIRFVFNESVDTLRYRIIYPENRFGQTVYSLNRDSVYVWFQEPLDSIKMVLDLGEKQDTIKLKPRQNLKYPPRLSALIGSTWHPGSDFRLRSNMPIASIDHNKIIVTAEDTLVTRIDSAEIIRYVLADFHFPRPKEGQYVLQILPNAVKYIDQSSNQDTLDVSFEILAKDEYGKLSLRVEPPGNDSLVFRLFAEGKEILTQIITDTTEIVIPHAVPGKYTMEAILDKNGNGRWDPGNVFKNRQPEYIIVNPQDVQIKANWEIDYTWSSIALPEDEQNGEIEEGDAVEESQDAQEESEEEEQEDFEEED